MKNKLFVLLLIVVIAGLSGIFCSRWLLPWLAGFPKLASISWIRQAKEGTTIINRTEKVVITESEALEEAIGKVSNTVVGIISQRTEKIVGRKKVTLKKPEILAQGNGFIVTSDGLVVTRQALVPEAAQEILVKINDKQFQAQVKKSEKSSELALLKIDETNLPVVSFAEGELKLGQPVFSIGIKIENQLIKFVESGIIKQLEPLAISFIDKDLNGSPLFNIRGEIIGVNIVGSQGEARIVPSSMIKELLKVF